MGISDFLSNLPPATLSLLAAGGAMAQGPTRVPVSPLYSLTQGLAALPQGQAQYNQLQQQKLANQGANIQNQTGQLNLDYLKQIQPYKLSALQQLSGATLPSQETPVSTNNIFGQSAKNNNFGNIKNSSGNFAQYPDPITGATAIPNNLLAYNDLHGINTINGIVNRWAPASDNNNVPAYVQDVSLRTGFKPDQPLNMRDPATLNALTTALSSHEGNPISPQMAQQAVTNALGQTKAASNIATQNSPDEQQQVQNLTSQLRLFKMAGMDTTGLQDQLNTLTKGMQDRQTKTYETALGMDKDMSESISPLMQAKQRLTDISNVMKLTQSGSFQTNKAAIYSGLQGMGINVDPSKLADASSVQQAMHDTYVETLKELSANAKGTGSRFTQNEVSALVGQSPNFNLQPAANQHLLAQSIGTINHSLGLVNDWYKQGGLGSKIHPTNFQAQWLAAHPIEDYINDAEKSIGPLKGMNGNNGSFKTITKQQFSPSTGKTKIVYSDGSEVIQ